MTHLKGDIEELLSAYVDGELDADAVREVEQLLAQDAQARRLVEQYRDTAGLLRAAFAEGFYADGAARLIERPARRVERRVRPMLWACAAALAACVIGFVGGVVWSGADGNPRSAMMDEISEYHQVYARETTHLVELGPDQTEEARRWLGHRIERRLDIPDFTGVGLAFAGARMFVVDGRPVAALLYTRDRGLPVAFCVTAFEGAPDALRVERRHGQRVAMWTDGGFAYLVVGDMEPGFARAVAELAAEQVKG